MRAVKTIWQKIEKCIQPVHKARRNAVWRALMALLLGGKLWPAALGRYRPGKATHKNSIKAIDRLLGNSLLYVELKLFYAAILQVLVQETYTPIILVDITEIHDGVCALTASLAHDGRGIPIYNVVNTKSCIAQRSFKQQFLRNLAAILPAGARPILITDAGFQSTWFDDVQDMGWEYVGRVRHQTKFRENGRWVSCHDLHERATKQPIELGMLPFPRKQPKARRMILAKKRKSKGRRRMNQKGKKGQTTNDKRCIKSAREPWLLSTSLSCPPASVVNIYAFRMQIEENYRDLKNKRWGWALDHYRSRKDGDYTRYEILFMIASLGILVRHCVGRAGEAKGLHHSCQANTVRRRRVNSLFVLGGFLLFPKCEHRFSSTDIMAGIRQICEEIRTLAEMAGL